MRKLAVNLIIALITFTIGTIISNLWSFRLSPQPKQFVTTWSAVQTNESLTSESQVKAEDPTNLIVYVLTDPDVPSFNPLKLELSKSSPTVVDLDLAESIVDQEITLGTENNSGEYRILQRYRTSMTVMAEGPHLDLLDWRHFDSTWTPLQKLDDHRFRTLADDRMDDTKFPPTTKAEMISAVRRRAGNDWPEIVELVKTCRGPNDGCCAVRISSIYLQVQKRVTDGWTNMGLVEFRIPMGC